MLDFTPFPYLQCCSIWHYLEFEFSPIPWLLSLNHFCISATHDLSFENTSTSIAIFDLLHQGIAKSYLTHVFSLHVALINFWLIDLADNNYFQSCLECFLLCRICFNIWNRVSSFIALPDFPFKNTRVSEWHSGFVQAISEFNSCVR